MHVCLHVCVKGMTPLLRHVELGHKQVVEAYIDNKLSLQDKDQVWLQHHCDSPYILEHDLHMHCCYVSARSTRTKQTLL